MHEQRDPSTWIQLCDGTPFWPLDPRPEDVSIAHIAHALSHLCRFAGHVREFYSVAQHSVIVSYICDPPDALAGLLHDASEAYLIDMPRPLKRSPALAGYREAERQLELVIARTFGLPEQMPASVRIADERLLATERRDLMAPPLRPWIDGGVEPITTPIDAWAPRRARMEFLRRFSELTRQSLGEEWDAT